MRGDVPSGESRDLDSRAAGHWWSESLTRGEEAHFGAPPMTLRIAVGKQVVALWGERPRLRERPASDPGHLARVAVRVRWPGHPVTRPSRLGTPLREVT